MKTLAHHEDIPLDDHLRSSVEAWRARHGVSAWRFGMAAMRDPDFVSSLMRGRSIRLKTADRVLAFMGEPTLGPVFRDEVEAFLAVTGTKHTMLGEETTGDPSFVGKLRRGVSPWLGTVDRVRAWMAAHASEDELHVIRERLTHMNDLNHLAGQSALVIPPDGPRPAGPNSNGKERYA